MSKTSTVNPHHLGHVIDASCEHAVAASEDIVSASGQKLVARGAPVNEQMRERLLAHKLRQPLEACLSIHDGITAQALHAAAQAALDQHPLLRSVYTACDGSSPLQWLRELQLSPALQTVLTLYTRQHADRLGHIAAVALLNLSLHQRLGRNTERRMASALTAALVHDAGELYLDPLVVQATSNHYEGWKQRCLHPMLGNKLLMQLPQPDLEAAAAVLEHHERLDGFGYPACVGGDALSQAGRMLAVAEVVAEALHDVAPANSAAVALKLIPAEFDRRVVDAVLVDGALARSERVQAEAPPLAQALKQFEAIATAIHGYESRRCALVTDLQKAPAVFREARERYERIVVAFNSTGLDVHAPETLTARLADDVPAEVRLELSLVLREVDRRFSDLRRQLKLRVSQLAPAHAALASQVLKTSAPMPL